MISRNQSTAGLLLTLFLAAAIPASAGIPLLGKKKNKDREDLPSRKLTASQNALVDKAIVREKEVIRIVRERAPLVETYIQNMKTDPVMLQIPESDQHFLGRVEFGKIIGDQSYQTSKIKNGKPEKVGFFHHSLGYLTGISGSLHMSFHEAGFVQMVLMDSNSFDRQHYTFGFVRNDFLGNIPTAVFDVSPIGGRSLIGGDKTFGRFFGRIWVESRNGNVVRFNGDFAGSEANIREFYHFDSWRTNVQEGMWLPTSIYVEESDPKSSSNTLKFKAINHIWGYVLKVPPPQTENTGVEVVGATDVSNEATDLSPLGAQRAWVQQAEDNVVERLFQAGLLDAPSEFDKTLEALASNILAYNNVAVTRPIRVRTLLTEPLESLSVGNTIIISKSLLDTTGIPTADGAQQMGNLNAILAFQVAHIISGHRLDTKYAFNDRLLFPTTSVFERIPMHHSDADNLEAAKKALELLNAKELVDGQKYFGLYLKQLQQSEKALKALNQPMIGDGLMKSDTDSTFWMAALMPKADKLDVKDIKQLAAMPLSSFLRRDPWTDQVIAIHPSYEPILSARDKMPFEVEPVYLKLAYYKTPVPPAAAGPASPSPTDPGTPPASASPAGSTTQPGAAAPVTSPATQQTAPPPQ